MQESVKHPAKKSCPLFRFHTTCIERLLKKKKDWAKCKSCRIAQKSLKNWLTRAKSRSIIDIVNSNGAVDVMSAAPIFYTQQE